jgi:RNA polymerase sigma-70 factor (ECF subfamily)
VGDIPTGGNRYNEDTELIGRVSQGDQDAVLALYDAYFSRIYSLIFNQVSRNREATDDIVQETFMAALKSAGKFNGRSKVYTWLYSIANRKVADFYRKQKRIDRHQFEPADSNFELDRMSDSKQAQQGEMDQGDDFLAVQQAIDELPLHYRQVLLLKYAEDMPIVEISQVMGRSQKSIEGLLTRARKELKGLLITNNDEERANDKGQISREWWRR